VIADELYCDLPLGRDPLDAFANMCVPPRTVVKSTQVAISGRVLLFSMLGACHHLGLVVSNQLAQAKAEVESRWGKQVDAFLQDVEARGYLANRAEAERTLASWRGPVIGSRPQLGRMPGPTRAICTDLGFAIAVLARVHGNLLLPSRAPTLTWPRLFDVVFGLDDARANHVPAYVYPEPELR
jgi:hypothetical protein